METVYDAENVTTCRSLVGTTPTKRDISLINRDSSVDDTFPRSERSSCPAYSICRGLKEPRRSLTHDDDRDQQVTILRDLLQPMKETALRLQHSVANIIKGDVQSSESLTRHHISQRDKKSQQSNPGSGLIITTTSSSVCALCGTELHPERPLKESGRLILDKKKTIDDYNRSHDITPRNFDDMLLRIIPCEIASSVETERNNDRLLIHKNVPECSKENNYNVQKMKKITSEIQSSDTREELRSKLLFTRQSSSTKTSQQGSQISLCPCTCKSLRTNRIRNGVSIGRKAGDITQKVEETKTQKLKNDESIVYCSKGDETDNLVKEEITRQQLQAQIEELHRNIRYFQEENEYLRNLIERCHYPSEGIKVSLQLLIRATCRVFGLQNHVVQSVFHKHEGNIRKNVKEVLQQQSNSYEINTVIEAK